MVRPGRLWGQQYPFERNHLQRTMTLTGLAGVFAVTLVLLVHADATGITGIALICLGAVSGMAAMSRHRYLQEARSGFDILRTRGGGFVLGSALAVLVVAAFVGLLVLRE